MRNEHNVLIKHVEIVACVNDISSLSSVVLFYFQMKERAAPRPYELLIVKMFKDFSFFSYF